MSPILHQSVFVSSCQGASVVAVRPTVRCTAAFPTVPPLTVSTPPMSPTTAAPSVGAVSLKSAGNQMFQVTYAREDSTHLESIHSASLNWFLSLKSLHTTPHNVFLWNFCKFIRNFKKTKQNWGMTEEYSNILSMHFWQNLEPQVFLKMKWQASHTDFWPVDPLGPLEGTSWAPSAWMEAWAAQPFSHLQARSVWPLVGPLKDFHRVVLKPVLWYLGCVLSLSSKATWSRFSSGMSLEVGMASAWWFSKHEAWHSPQRLQSLSHQTREVCLSWSESPSGASWQTGWTWAQFWASQQSAVNTFWLRCNFSAEFLGTVLSFFLHSSNVG